MFLFGASGHSKVIIDSLTASGISIGGLFDDNPDIKRLLEYPVFGAFNKDILGDDSLIISVGVNNIRKKIVEKLPHNLKYGRAIHPSSIMSNYASIGVGTVIMQGSVIQSCVNIGKHCIINTSATVDHDCQIEDYVHISPNATLCGGVSVGEGTQVGAGAVIIPGIKIGKWSLVAAGAVVIKDVPDNVLVLGNPARVVKKILP
ncbi:MAG: acetyltransferase [Bacteroidetes bacterium HGW-Bacteroidetes-8]|jgi:sugar O-acyltransferase (sialic acid O-acetyltransferase NeuD family)|nr:MAG: acetyltransferase [Bacteroidetes bacterium HGW-Bacteroidetes-8]